MYKYTYIYIYRDRNGNRPALRERREEHLLHHPRLLHESRRYRGT